MTWVFRAPVWHVSRMEFAISRKLRCTRWRGILPTGGHLRKRDMDHHYARSIPSSDATSFVLFLIVIGVTPEADAMSSWLAFSPDFLAAR